MVKTNIQLILDLLTYWNENKEVQLILKRYWYNLSLSSGSSHGIVSIN